MTIGKRHVFAIGVVGLFLGLTLTAAIDAQQALSTASGGVTQKFLLNEALTSIPGKQVDVFIGQFKPGSRTPMHRHPGMELLYVLEGQGEMIIPGRDSKPLKAGEIVMVEPAAGEDSFVHLAVNRSETEEMKTLVIVIHDKGTPIATPVSDDAQR